MGAAARGSRSALTQLARPAGHAARVEAGHSGRSGGLCRAVPGLCGGCALPHRLEHRCELACRHRTVDDLGRCRLCRDAGIRAQPNRLRQGRVGGLLRERSGNRACPGFQADVRRRKLCGLCDMPWLVPRFFKRYGGRPSELETKLLLLVMFGLGALALWAGSEPVLPAYVLGMILAGAVGRDHALVRRLRTLTFGLLTPFYFIRAGSFVSTPALVAAPGVLLVLLAPRWCRNSSVFIR